MRRRTLAKLIPQSLSFATTQFILELHTEMLYKLLLASKGLFLLHRLQNNIKIIL